MSFWSDLDPTGNNFLGLGDRLGRVLAGIGTAGGSEFHRTDPFGTAPGSIGNKIGRGLGGAGPGAVGGFVTGGIPGAIVGGVGGGIAGGTGATNSSTLSGFGEDVGIGAGAGGLAGYLGGSGLAGALGGSGSSAGAGASGAGTMIPYTPTSTPVMSQAGSTLGGGIGSPLNLTASDVGSSSPSWQSLVKNLISNQSGGGSGGSGSSQNNGMSPLEQSLMGILRDSQKSSKINEYRQLNNLSDYDDPYNGGDF